MWQLVTSIETKEQGIIILLESQKGNSKAEKAVSDLTDAELYTEDGLDLLLLKLDLVFQSETIDEAYNIYTKFITFTRSHKMNMNEYIIENEHLNLKMNKNKMKLPDAVLTFKLLDGARITSEEQKLALAMSGEQMK